MSDLILLIEAPGSEHDRAAVLRRAGFSVEVASRATIGEREMLTIAPALIAVELEQARSSETFDFARRLRAHTQLRRTPIIVFAALLNAEHIETAARNGLLWLQITPIDKLVAAVRGLLSATGGASGPLA